MNIKKAFTLGEALIVFVIIGVIATLGLTIVKPWDRQYKIFYQRMYHSIQLAVYNHMLNSADSAFPKTRTELCQALLEYINTADNAQTCGGFNPGENPGAAVFSDPKSELNKPDIIASNGARIWIGSSSNDPFELEQTICTEYAEDNTTCNTALKDKVNYYLVYVDINGDKAPNSPVWSSSKIADVVVFAVTDNFEVIPLGYPQVDARYLSAHVIYPALETEYSTSENVSKTVEEEVSDPMTYYEARTKAYGDKVISGVHATYSWDDKLGATFKITAIDNSSKTGTAAYNSFYETAPEFDETCSTQDLDASGSSQTTYDKYANSVCSVKIYEYH